MTWGSVGLVVKGRDELQPLAALQRVGLGPHHLCWFCFKRIQTSGFDVKYLNFQTLILSNHDEGQLVFIPLCKLLELATSGPLSLSVEGTFDSLVVVVVVVLLF